MGAWPVLDSRPNRAGRGRQILALIDGSPGLRRAPSTLPSSTRISCFAWSATPLVLAPALIATEGDIEAITSSIGRLLKALR
jgi:hypothetical protein